MRFILRRILKKPEPTPPSPQAHDLDVSDWAVFAAYARMAGPITRYHFTPGWFVEITTCEDFRELPSLGQVSRQYLMHRGYEVEVRVEANDFIEELLVHYYGRVDRDFALRILRHYYIMAPITGERVPDTFRPGS